jgi:Mrp family chromosome partitioning ATPase
MGELLARLTTQADIVLCDCAHAVSIADALVLSSQVDGVILVVEPGKTRRAAAEQAVYNLQQAGANLLGALVSPLPTAQKIAPVKAKPSALALVNGKHGAHQEPTIEPLVNQLAQAGLNKS